LCAAAAKGPQKEGEAIRFAQTGVVYIQYLSSVSLVVDWSHAFPHSCCDLHFYIPGIYFSLENSKSATDTHLYARCDWVGIQIVI